jgi:hypothetical protein
MHCPYIAAQGSEVVTLEEIIEFPWMNSEGYIFVPTFGILGSFIVGRVLLEFTENLIRPA